MNLWPHTSWTRRRMAPRRFLSKTPCRSLKTRGDEAGAFSTTKTKTAVKDMTTIFGGKQLQTQVQYYGGSYFVAHSENENHE